ncbi:mitochondrial genome maintenance exonuclease 1-like [Odontomachus brunneus]|uniref:mitochondrial genome maintenance exonuclease 1-like n=1 Tax=Odontomachus brunneus TaxID=486640 RepID=UPI0013F24302|nr:mitochondrial genome maintenance exonuclease 1-like [Odontomachus brunneus]XP_032677612.1 mitochondrial genome maintenance exonuclease 1-like [Odontomachus brunneus]
MISLRISNCFLRTRSSEISNICQTSVRHLSKANKIKKLMTEMKEVFGNLLETNSQKKRRLKLEKRGKIPREKQNNIDTEFSWVMKQSLNNPQKNSLKKMTLVSTKQSSEHEDTSRTNSTNSPKNLSTATLEDEKLFNKNTKNTRHSEFSQHTQKITANTTSQSKPVENNNSHGNTSLPDSNATDIENVATKSSALEKHFDIIIKNIQSFSILGNKRESSAELTEALSASAKKDESMIKVPSVSAILTHTMSPESKLILEAWKKKMIKKLGQEGFDKYQKALLNDGTSLHTCIAHSLLGEEYEIPPRIEPVFKSVQSVLKNVCHVKGIEAHVTHTKLRYKGIVDCIASYRGENYVIDWKKSDKKKLDLKGTYDAPVQVAAYIGAINASNLYPFVIKRGLIVVAYTCGDPATVHEMCDDTLQEYWTMWLRRLQQYHVEMAKNDNMSNKTLM